MRIAKTLLDRPQTVYGALVPTLIACWFLAGVGGDRTKSDGALYRIGSTFWLLFGLTLLVTVAYSIALVVRRLLRRRSPAS